jgi:RNA polymerase sigma factor (sigma-70 family)
LEELSMNAEDIFLEQISTIDSIVSYVCRKNRLDPFEAEDFLSFVKIELMDNNYEIIRKFEERSTIGTYLTTVIQHLFYQHRVRMWGKWRPSAEAKRLGDKAVALERLVYRDGLSLSEAIQTLTTGGLSTGSDGEYSRRELEAFWFRLPIRMPRPVLVSQANPPDAAVENDADDRLMANARQELARKAARTMDEVLARMPANDRLMLKLRFWDGWKVPRIAEYLGIDPKKAYKRIDKLIAVIRRELERAGISREVVADLLWHDDSEIRSEELQQMEGKSSLASLQSHRRGRGRR